MAPEKCNTGPRPCHNQRHSRGQQRTPGGLFLRLSEPNHDPGLQPTGHAQADSHHRQKGGDSFGPIEPDLFWKVASLALSAQAETGCGRSAPRHPVQPRWHGETPALVRSGQGINWGRFADGKYHFFVLGGSFDCVLDAKYRTWTPGTHWKRPKRTGRLPWYYFANGKQNYGVYFGKAGTSAIAGMLPAGSVKPLMQYRKGPAGLMVTGDTNGDGRIDQADSDTPVLGMDGMPITAWHFGNTRSLSSIDWQADGSLIHGQRGSVARIPLRATATGIPEFDFASAQVIVPGVNGSPTYRSPYDFRTEEKVSLAEDMAWFGREGFAAVITTKTGAGPDLCTEHANGTSMAGFDATGQLRWFNALNPVGLKMGFWGITSLGGITFAGRGAVVNTKRWIAMASAPAPSALRRKCHGAEFGWTTIVKPTDSPGTMARPTW